MIIGPFLPFSNPITLFCADNPSIHPDNRDKDHTLEADIIP